MMSSLVCNGICNRNCTCDCIEYFAASHDPNLICSLESRGNVSSDWSKVFFSDNQSADWKDFLSIRNCEFHGCIQIGRLSVQTLPVTVHSNFKSTEEQIEFQTTCGLVNSSFSGQCILGNYVTVRDSRVHNTTIGNRTAVIGCASVTNNRPASVDEFGFTTEIKVGAESGGNGRRLKLYPCMSYHKIVNQLSSKTAKGGYDSDAVLSVERDIFESKRRPGRVTFIDSDCLLFHCSIVRNCFIGSGSSVSFCSLDECILITSTQHALETPSSSTSIELFLKSNVITINAGANLAACTLHRGCKVDKNCLLSNVYMCEMSSVSECARLNHVILAPDASVAGAEVHRSILGPFIGLHHTSLVIACSWPYGRGNVSYGAMVGANHSGRVNDQESIVGEGVFFGLGVSLRFPFNCSSAVYSIVAAGTSLTPQCISLPFSLITSSHSDVTVVLKPGWVLWGNAYFVERSDLKFSSRRSAIDHATDYPLMRPYIINLVMSARDHLKSFLARASTVDSSEDTVALRLVQEPIPGAGSCVVSIKDVGKGCLAYSSFIRRYSLQVLTKELWGNIGDVTEVALPAKLLTESFQVICNLKIPLRDLIDAVEFIGHQTSSDDSESDASTASDLDQVLCAIGQQMDIDLFMTSSRNQSRFPPVSLARAVMFLHSLAILRRETPDLCKTWEFRAEGNCCVPFCGSIRALLNKWRDIEKIIASCTAISTGVQIQVLVPLRDTIGSLSLLAELHHNFSEAVQSSRSKDNQRGCSIIEDYALVNGFAADGHDDVTLSARRKLLDTQNIMSYFQSLQDMPSSF